MKSKSSFTYIIISPIWYDAGTYVYLEIWNFAIAQTVRKDAHYSVYFCEAANEWHLQNRVAMHNLIILTTGQQVKKVTGALWY